MSAKGSCSAGKSAPLVKCDNLMMQCLALVYARGIKGQREEPLYSFTALSLSNVLRISAVSFTMAIPEERRVS